MEKKKQQHTGAEFTSEDFWEMFNEAMEKGADPIGDPNWGKEHGKEHAKNAEAAFRKKMEARKKK